MRLRFLTLGLFCLLVVLFGTPSAFAQAADGGDAFNLTGISDGCGATMNVDECMWGGSSDTNGGNYQSCTAAKSQGQTCQDVDLMTGGPYECVSVYRSAYCSCNTETLRKTGTCTYVNR